MFKIGNMNNLVNKFREIRDIKYQIPLKSEEPDSCCSGKMKLFKEWLDNNNYISKYRVCGFKWSDLKLPQKISRISHQDESTHVYLEVYLDNQWVDVDPTWDSGLEGILPVNDWEGKSNCEVAVPVLNKYSDQESAQIMKSSFDIEDIQTNGEFYKAFNDYLEQCRNI